MFVLYTSDNEAPTAIDLDQLLANFKTSGVTGCEAVDIRDALAQEGWFTGTHDDGRYVIINFDKLGLTPKPDMLDQMYANYRAVKAAPVVVPATEAKAVAETSRFHTWFDGVVAKAATTEIGKRMLADGYSVQHTGGGCLAWERQFADGRYVYICDEGNGLGDEMGELYLCGLYDKDGDSIDVDAAQGLDKALDWAREAEAIEAPKKACQHRDDGRGRCIDCGAFL